MTSPIDSTSARSARLNWIAVSLALVALAITAVMGLRGAPVKWTAWALPLIILVNVGTPVLGRSRPQLARVVMFASMCVVVAIIVALVAPMLRR